MLGEDPPSGEIQIKVHPRRGDKVVHPTSTSTPPASLSPLPPPLPDDFQPFKQWFPWMVPTFTVANILMFIITMYVNNCPKNSPPCIATFLGRFSFQPFKENLLLGPSINTLEKMGALKVDLVVKEHQSWRLITCMWLHANVVHVLTNMLSLVIIGIRLEKEFGFLRIGPLYLISGIGGSIVSALFIEAKASVGASGALFGLLGAMLSELLMNWTIYANKVAALLTLILIIAVNLAMGLIPGVDNFAHIGGFLTGFFLGFILLIRPQFRWIRQQHPPPGYRASSLKPKHKTYQYVLWVLSFLLVTAGLTLGLIMLLRGVNAFDYCQWCHYLSCSPTSKWSCKEQHMFCERQGMENGVNLTCLSNGKSKGRSNIYTLADYNESQLEALCIGLCS